MILKAITGVTVVTLKKICIYEFISILNTIYIGLHEPVRSVLLYPCAGSVAAVTVNVNHYRIRLYSVTPRLISVIEALRSRDRTRPWHRRKESRTLC